MPDRSPSSETMSFFSPYDLSTNSDTEWIRRELGITWVKASTHEFVRAATHPGPRVGVLLTDTEACFDYVAAAPPDRVVVLHLYDLHYRHDGREMVHLPSIHRAYRTYSLDRASTPRYVSVTLASLADARFASTDPRQVAAAVRSGLRTRSAIRRYEHEDPDRIQTVPLGYTAKFAAAFTSRFGPAGTDESLFDHVLQGTAPNWTGDRNLDVSFRGARGQFQRRTGVHLASTRPRSDSTAPVRAFSGKGEGLDAETYIEQMTDSRFALCPPGYSANESYRIAESLLCGALPVMLATAVSQGTRPPAHLAATVRGLCWTAALRSMDRMAEPARRAAVLRALAALREAHWRAAASILAALRG